MRGDCGVAGEGRLVGVPKFHSWGKCTLPSTAQRLPLTCDYISYITRILGSPKFAWKLDKNHWQVINSANIKNAAGKLPRLYSLEWMEASEYNFLCNAYNLWSGNETRQPNAAAR